MFFAFKLWFCSFFIWLLNSDYFHGDSSLKCGLYLDIEKQRTYFSAMINSLFSYSDLDIVLVNIE